METWWRCIKLREVSILILICVISLAAVIYRWFRCRGGGSHSTSPQPDPAVSKSGFLMCRRPQGLKFTTGYPPPSKEPTVSNPSSESGPHNHFQVRFSRLSASIRSVVCLIWCQCFRALHGVQQLYLTHKLTPSINTGRGKGAETDLWSGNGAASKTQLDM